MKINWADVLAKIPYEFCRSTGSKIFLNNGPFQKARNGSVEPIKILKAYCTILGVIKSVSVNVAFVPCNQIVITENVDI